MTLRVMLRVSLMMLMLWGYHGLNSDFTKYQLTEARPSRLSIDVSLSVGYALPPCLNF